MPLAKVNIAQKFSLIRDYWKPRIAGEINDCYLKMVKLKGEFVWHQHEHEDELFLVVKGTMIMRLRGCEVRIQEGEFFIVPKGVEHMPVAPGRSPLPAARTQVHAEYRQRAQ